MSRSRAGAAARRKGVPTWSASLEQRLGTSISECLVVPAGYDGEAISVPVDHHSAGVDQPLQIALAERERLVFREPQLREVTLLQNLEVIARVVHEHLEESAHEVARDQRVASRKHHVRRPIPLKALLDVREDAAPVHDAILPVRPRWQEPRSASRR